jgi:hypothetical protein
MLGFLDRLRSALFRPLDDALLAARSQQPAQLLLAQKYRELRDGRRPLPSFRDVEFRCFSQNGEDGILLYIFSLIGATDRRAVELGAGDGVECNAANLIINHGWTGLLVDGSRRAVSRGRRFYARCRTTWVWPPTLVEAWITAENVNEIVAGSGFGGEMDLLSVDVDGMDYWIWRALTAAQPRVVVIEFNDIWGTEATVTVPYRPEFRAEFRDGLPDYAGASLGAMVKLGREKGYRLVGCQSYGFNAFFVRNGIAEDLLPRVEASACLSHPKVQDGMRTRLPRVRGREWVEV